MKLQLRIIHLHNGQPLPLWAIFEIIDMGTFGMFLKCLNEPIRIKNCQNLSITYTGLDPHGILVQDIIFALKELRNAVAHNNVVFDCRFKPPTNNIPTDILNYLQYETTITNINFTFLSDYLILLIVLLKKFGRSTTELRKIIRDFREECELLRNKIPINIWHQIVGTNISTKLSGLDNYV